MEPTENYVPLEVLEQFEQLLAVVYDGAFRQAAVMFALDLPADRARALIDQAERGIAEVRRRAIDDAAEVRRRRDAAIDVAVEVMRPASTLPRPM